MAFLFGVVFLFNMAFLFDVHVFGRFGGRAFV